MKKIILYAIAIINILFANNIIAKDNLPLTINYTIPKNWHKYLEETKNNITTIKYIPIDQEDLKYRESITIRKFNISTSPLDQYLRSLKNKMRLERRMMVTNIIFAELNTIPTVKYGISYSQSPNCNYRCGEYWVTIIARNNKETIEITRNWKGPMFPSRTIPIDKDLEEEWERFFNIVAICPANYSSNTCKNWYER